MFEQFSRPLKVALLILFVALLAVLVLVILTQRGLLGKKIETIVVPTPTSQSQTETPQGSPASPSSPQFPISEDAPKIIKDLKAQLDAGTITPEEARKQLEASNAQTAP
ncbi:MAG: hypothetical protein A3J06_02430 [Candidatus Moranbacteria bacterium RIFCSPLOWO2_02_FULL_48_19]|nr:MAG: hypothetical protein A3J06_02430 [Candidatus Moranbacteria bacterium RIFCSPLOWO2_02_FULL_48_19]OGI30343.1 MAG: hypothetical protein A3G09_02625 [Candidatus Moranbacteria bacterium RIFCSPLOWO2_12_FULL_48_12]